MYFRPILKLTLAVVPVFAILVGLGVWQIERLHWKLGLIAQVDQNLSAPPISLARALALGPAAQYHRVALAGSFVNAKEAYVFATDTSGAPGYHVVAPLKTDDGRIVLVDRGFVPRELFNLKTLAAGRLEGERHVVGVWRVPDAPGLFTPAPDVTHRVWYSRDAAGIAKTERLTLAALAIVEADATPNPGGWPKGGQTAVEFRNEHLQYAITWFLMAAALLAVYLFYHRGQGRLGIR
jgi:surfeit locus 1 family protein